MYNRVKKIIYVILSDYWVYKFNFAISILFLWLSPVAVISWLLLFTFYTWYIGNLNWKNFIRTWSPILSLWYLIILVSLINYSPVIIGPGYTEELLSKALSDGLTFERICLSTVLMLHIISAKLGIPLVIPMLNIFKSDNTSCAGKDDNPKPKPTPNAKPYDDNISHHDQAAKDAEMCRKLASAAAANRPTSWFSLNSWASKYYSHNKETLEGRTTHKLSGNMPGFGNATFCFTIDDYKLAGTTTELAEKNRKLAEQMAAKKK